MDHVHFAFVALAEARDASGRQSGHSGSVTRGLSREPAPLIVQVTRASRRCLPASETLPPPSQGALPTRAACWITWGATPAARCLRRSAGTEAVSSNFRRAAG